MRQIEKDILNGKVKNECSQCGAQDTPEAKLGLHPVKPEIWCISCFKKVRR